MVDSILSKLNNSKIVLFLQKYEKISNDGKWQKQTSKNCSINCSFVPTF